MGPRARSTFTSSTGVSAAAAWAATVATTLTRPLLRPDPTFCYLAGIDGSDDSPTPPKPIDPALGLDQDVRPTLPGACLPCVSHRACRHQIWGEDAWPSVDGVNICETRLPTRLCPSTSLSVRARRAVPHGAAERCVQLVEDQSRTLKAALGDMLGWNIPFDHPRCPLFIMPHIC